MVTFLQQLISYAFKNYPKKHDLSYKHRIPELFYIADCISAEKTGKVLTGAKWVKSLMPDCREIHTALRTGCSQSSNENDMDYRPLFTLERKAVSRFDTMNCDMLYNYNPSHIIWSTQQQIGHKNFNPSKPYFTLETQQTELMQEAIDKSCKSDSDAWVTLIFDSKPMQNAVKHDVLDFVKAYKL